MPRILSPAYFHHYNVVTSHQTPAEAQTSVLMSKPGEKLRKQKAERTKENEGEQLVLGLGPVQNSFWRLSRLVPLEGVRRQLDRVWGKKVPPENSLISDSGVTSSIDDTVTSPQYLEIQEDSDGISLRPLPETDADATGEVKNGKSRGKNSTNHANKKAWRPMPTLPSYVPFGQVHAHVVTVILCYFVLFHFLAFSLATKASYCILRMRSKKLQISFLVLVEW